MGQPPTFMNRLLRRAAKRWLTFAGLRSSEVTELREVKNAEGVHVPMAFSSRGHFEFSGSYSLCGAAACLDAAGWPLSEPVAALSRRWADLGQKPNPKGVAMARFYLGA